MPRYGPGQSGPAPKLSPRQKRALRHEQARSKRQSSAGAPRAAGASADTRARTTRADVQETQVDPRTRESAIRSGGRKPTLADIRASEPEGARRKRARALALSQLPRSKASFGFDLGKALGFDKNLAAGLIKSAQGIPAGVMGLRHPVREAKAIGKGYAKTYGPLVHGDVKKFEREFYKNPAGPVLDALAGASTIAGAGAKLGLLKVPTERSLAFEGGKVQPLASPNTLTRIAEHKLDRFSEKHPHAPVVGAKARVARRIPFERERGHERSLSQGIPFAKARKRLSKSEDFAYDRIMRYGDKVRERVPQEITFRRDALAKATTLVEKRGQRKTLLQLQAAAPHFANPSPRLQEAVREGRALAGKTQATKVDVGALTPETAAERIHLPSRIVTRTEDRARGVQSEYRGQHTPNAGTEPGASMDNPHAIYPPDLYSRDAARLYGHGDDAQSVARDRQTVRLIQSVKGKPDAEIKVYRAIPKGVAGAIHPGDWVTPNKAYATEHGESALRGRYTIVSRKVRVADLHTNAESIHEWGWNPPKAAEAGEGAAFVPDISRTPIKSIGQRMKSVTGKPRPLTQKSEGILFRQGRTRSGSKLTLEDFQKTTRYRSHLLDIKDAEQFSKPLHPDIPGGLEPGHRYFNPQGVKLPRSFRDAPAVEDIEGLTPKEIGQAAAADYESLVRNTFPDEAGVRNLPPEVAQKVRQIDEGIVRSFESGGHRFAGHGGALGKTLASVFDATNNITRAGALYLKGAFVPANFLGNAAFGVIHAGPWYFKNLATASAKLGRLSTETLNRIDLEMGSGAARSIGGEGKGLLGPAVHKIANVSGYLADNGPRRAAFIHEAAKAGFKKDADIQRLFSDPTLASKLNQISETAENAMVKFRGLSADERAIISRAIFIYPWIKGATRYAGRLPLDRPGRADLVAHLGEQGSNDTEKQLGKLVSFMEGIVPVGKTVNGIVPVKNPMSVTPLGTGAQVAQAVEGALSSKSVPTSERLAAFFSPAVKAGVEAATGYNTFLGRSYPADTGTREILTRNLISGFPISKLATGLVSPPKAGVPGRHVYVPEGGGRRGVLERFMYGSLRTRHLNLPAEQKLARQEQMSELDPVQRIKTRHEEYGQKILEGAIKTGLLPKGSKLSPNLTKALKIRTERYVNREKLGAVGPGTSREKFEADVRLLEQHKVIPKAKADKAIKWVKDQKRDYLVERELRHLSDYWFDDLYGNTLAQARHDLRERGYDLPNLR